MNIKEWDRGDWALCIAIIVAISFFLVWEIMLINGTGGALFNGMKYDTAREEVTANGFSVFLGYNFIGIILSGMIGLVINMIIALLDKTGLIVFGSIILAVAIKYGLYKIFF